MSKQVLQRVGPGEMQNHASDRDGDRGGHLQQPQADHLDLSTRHVRFGKISGPQFVQKHVRETREQQAGLVDSKSWQLVRSANSIDCCFLFQFSMSAPLSVSIVVETLRVTLEAGNDNWDQAPVVGL